MNARMGHRERALIQLVNRKSGIRKCFVELRQCRLRVGAESVVAESDSPLWRQVARGFVVPAPERGCRDGIRFDPINGWFAPRKQRNRVEPHQALDDTCVMAEHQHEERVGKDLRQRRRDEHVAWR